jgi:hypothetical protein
LTPWTWIITGTLTAGEGPCGFTNVHFQGLVGEDNGALTGDRFNQGSRAFLVLFGPGALAIRLENNATEAPPGGLMQLNR